MVGGSPTLKPCTKKEDSSTILFTILLQQTPFTPDLFMQNPAVHHHGAQKESLREGRLFTDRGDLFSKLKPYRFLLHPLLWFVSTRTMTGSLYAKPSSTSSW